MDPKHRDRIAFVRLCSGHFERGMKLHHVPRTGKTLGVHNPMLFQAHDRELAEEAWAGDIIGIPNHGTLRIGDALTEGEAAALHRHPELRAGAAAQVRADDPMKAKHLGRALEQLAEEGAAQVFKPLLGSDWIVGVVGALQFDVLADRIRTEYDLAGPLRGHHALHRPLGRRRRPPAPEALRRRQPRRHRRGSQRRTGLPGQQRLAFEDDG